MSLSSTLTSRELYAIEYLSIVSEYSSLKRISGSQLIFKAAALRILDKCFRLLSSFEAYIPQKQKEFLLACCPGWESTKYLKAYVQSASDYNSYTSQFLYISFKSYLARLYPHMFTNRPFMAAQENSLFYLFDVTKNLHELVIEMRIIALYSTVDISEGFI